MYGVGALGACGTKHREFEGEQGGEAGQTDIPRGGSDSPVGGRGGQAGSTAGGGSGGEGGGNDDGGSGPLECGDTENNPENCGICGHSCEADQMCGGGECQALPDHCKDKQANEDEPDVGCGGSCEKCVEGQICGVASDCATGFCNAQQQCAVPSCTDSAQNGYETGPDCGGATCRDLNLRCDDGVTCEADQDCKTSFCSGGKCASPTCTDEVQNQGETYIDCGGPICRINISPFGTCPNGKACGVDGDCTSQFCKDKLCAKPTCEDGAKNQDETGVDCGGPTCRTEPNGKCPDAQGCGGPTDCASGFCSSGKLCSPAGCGNGAKDSNETDLDCGGNDCRETKPCAVGKACAIHADCGSGSCKSNKCVAATCGDGLKNQDETDVDCGGAICSAAGKTRAWLPGSCTPAPSTPRAVTCAVGATTAGASSVSITSSTRMRPVS